MVEADCRFLLFAHHQAVMDTMEETLKKMKVGYIRRSDEGFRIGFSQEAGRWQMMHSQMGVPGDLGSLSQELVGGLGY